MAAPTGARRAPFLVIALVLLLVLGVLVLAVWRIGWLVALLAPVVAMCVWIAVQTIRVMRRSAKGEEGEREEP